MTTCEDFIKKVISEIKRRSPKNITKRLFMISVNESSEEIFERSREHRPQNESADRWSEEINLKHQAREIRFDSQNI